MSTSKLQRHVSDLLSIHLASYTIRENIRPDWLIGPRGERLELDFFIEELDTAIEVQGDQHYVYTPFFHKDYDDFLRRQLFDEYKREICTRVGIDLYAIDAESDCLPVIEKLQSKFHIPPVKRKSSPVVSLSPEIAIQKFNLMLSAITATLYQADRKHLGADYCRLLTFTTQFHSIITPQLSNEQWKSVIDLLSTTQNHLKSMPKVKEPKIWENPKKPRRPIRIKEPVPILKCSQNVRRRARRLLSIKQVDLFTWVVWGGSEEHTITFEGSNLVCDCRSFVAGKTTMCSHIAKYCLEYQYKTLATSSQFKHVSRGYYEPTPC